MKFFWREKNAEAFIGKCEVITPTSSEIFDEIIKKFSQKTKRIDLIFDKAIRKAFIESGNFSNNIDIQNLDEKEIQQKIGLNILVDFVQLIKDLCSLKNINLDVSDIESVKISYPSIKQDLEHFISKLKEDVNLTNTIQNIYIITLSLAKHLTISYEEIEKLRQHKENKEGTFLNGKYVIKEENE